MKYLVTEGSMDMENNEREIRMKSIKHMLMTKTVLVTMR